MAATTSSSLSSIRPATRYATPPPLVDHSAELALAESKDWVWLQWELEQPSWPGGLHPPTFRRRQEHMTRPLTALVAANTEAMPSRPRWIRVSHLPATTARAGRARSASRA